MTMLRLLLYREGRTEERSAEPKENLWKIREIERHGHGHGWFCDVRPGGSAAGGLWQQLV